MGQRCSRCRELPKLSKLKRTTKITTVPASDVPDPFSCFGELLTAMPIPARAEKAFPKRRFHWHLTAHDVQSVAVGMESVFVIT